MQSRTEPPRDGFTVAQVEALIQDCPAVIVGSGLELVDMNLDLIEDISGDMTGGAVERSSFADLHGSFACGMSRELDWGNAIIRPYYTMSDGIITVRFNMGAYIATSPKLTIEQEPSVQDLVGYDILHGLSDTVGEAYAVEVGTVYLTAVEEILIARGYTRYVIDQQAATSTMVSPRVWALDENIKWITIVNDLLAAIGYRGIYSDWNGYLRAEPYLIPSDRANEWIYTSVGDAAMIAPKRSMDRDFFTAPNRWVAVRSNEVDGAQPLEGNGIYTLVNEFDGPTSVTARNGRTVTRYLSFEAADQAALITQTDAAAAADKALSTKFELTTQPNPLHWHFDRVLLDDPEVGPARDCQVTKWTLPFDGGDMSHEWTAI